MPPDPSDSGTPLWSAGKWKWFATPSWLILVASILLQLALALLFGHSEDARIFMATGYLVGGGHNPYVPMELSAVFDRGSFDAMRSIGYPPPWPLLLGPLYLGTYDLIPNLLLYNLAIKIPVVAANIGLAYLVAAILKNRGATPDVTRKAWIFLLFNPLLLYFGAAWGQIDPIVALLALAALVLVYRWRRPDLSAVLLALAVCFKPTAAPILLVVLVYTLGRSPRQAVRYLCVFLAGAMVFAAVPFLVMGWSPAPILRHWNAHFAMSGTMSLMTVVKAAGGPAQTAGDWWLLGLAWVPALVLAAALALRRGVGDFADLIKKSTALVLVFFLTRTWLAEPNVILIMVLVLILASLGELDRRALTAVWVIPLVFTAFNLSPLRLLFVAFPGDMERSLAFVGQYGTATLVARAVLVVAWQVAGWWIVMGCFRTGRRAAVGHGPGSIPRERAHSETAWN